MAHHVRKSPANGQANVAFLWKKGWDTKETIEKTKRFDVHGKHNLTFDFDLFQYFQQHFHSSTYNYYCIGSQRSCQKLQRMFELQQIDTWLSLDLNELTRRERSLFFIQPIL